MGGDAVGEASGDGEGDGVGEVSGVAVGDSTIGLTGGRPWLSCVKYQPAPPAMSRASVTPPASSSIIRTRRMPPTNRTSMAGQTSAEKSPLACRSSTATT